MVSTSKLRCLEILTILYPYGAYKAIEKFESLKSNPKNEYNLIG